MIPLLVLGESGDYGNQLPNSISDLILIGFDLDPNRFGLIWRFNWSKVDHDGPAAALPASSSQQSWKAHVAKSENSSSAELDIVCGEATEILLRGCAWLQAKLTLCGVNLSSSGEAVS